MVVCNEVRQFLYGQSIVIESCSYLGHLFSVQSVELVYIVPVVISLVFNIPCHDQAHDNRKSILADCVHYDLLHIILLSGHIIKAEHSGSEPDPAHPSGAALGLLCPSYNLVKIEIFVK